MITAMAAPLLALAAMTVNPGPFVEWGIEAAFDGDLSLQGDVDLDLWPDPSLRISDFDIAGSVDKTPITVTGRTFQMQLALRPLFSGNIIVDALSAADIVVEITNTSGPESSELVKTDIDAFDMDTVPVFHDLTVENLSVNFQIDGRDRRLNVDRATANEILATSDNAGRTEINIQARIEGRPLSITGSVGSVRQALDAQPFPVNISITHPGIDVSVNGDIAQVLDGEGLSLTTQVASEDLTLLADILPPNWPILGKLTAEGVVSGAIDQFRLTEVSLSYTDNDNATVFIAGDIDAPLLGKGLVLDVDASVGLASDIAAFVLADHVPALLLKQGRVDIQGQIAGSVAHPILQNALIRVDDDAGGSIRVSGMAEDLINGTGLGLDYDIALAAASPLLKLLNLKQFSLDKIDLTGTARGSLTTLATTVSKMTFKHRGGANGVANGKIIFRDGHPNDGFFDVKGYAQNLSDLNVLTGLELQQTASVNLSAHVSVEQGQFSLKSSETHIDGHQSGSPRAATIKAHGSLGNRFKEIKLNVGADIEDIKILLDITGHRNLPSLPKGPIRATLNTTIGVSADGVDLTGGDVSLANRDTWAIRITDAHMKTHADMKAPEFEGRFSTQITGLGHLMGEVGVAHFRNVTSGQSNASFSYKAGSWQLSAPDITINHSIGPLANGHVALSYSATSFKVNGEVQAAVRDLLAFSGLPDVAEPGKMVADFAFTDAGDGLHIERLALRMDNSDNLTLRAQSVINSPAQNRGIEIAIDGAIASPEKLMPIASTFKDLRGPLTVRGQLRGNGDETKFKGQFTIGKSIVGADLKGTFDDDRPSLSGKITSDIVYLADFGIVPHDDAEDARAQTASNSTTVKSTPLFSSEPFDLSALSAANLDIRFLVDEVSGVGQALDKFEGRIRLKDEYLNLNPLVFTFAKGTTRTSFSIHGKVKPGRQVHHELIIKSDDLDIGDWLKQTKTKIKIDGDLDMNLKLRAEGNSAKSMADTLNGELNFALSRGKVHSTLLAFTGTNLMTWLFRDASSGYTNINCMISRFDVQGGNATVGSLLLDTPTMTSAGKGNVNLSKERLDILVDPEPKTKRLAEFTTPFRIKGALSHPEIEISKVGLAARMIGEVAFTPLNALGSLFSIVRDSGKDDTNPCLARQPN
jgi:hypothetical protein